MICVGMDTRELDRLLTDGIKQVDAEKKITIIDTEIKAVEQVLNNPVPGGVSVIFADDVQSVIAQVQKACLKHQGKALEVCITFLK